MDKVYRLGNDEVVKILKEALESYADKKNWYGYGFDLGSNADEELAQQVLKELESV